MYDFTNGPDTSKSMKLVFITEHIWDARVIIADMIVLGESRHGHRRIIPITGKAHCVMIGVYQVR